MSHRFQIPQGRASRNLLTSFTCIIPFSFYSWNTLKVKVLFSHFKGKETEVLKGEVASLRRVK
jgi:hypothetical protein